MSAKYCKGSSKIISAGCYIPPEIVKTNHLLAEISPERFGIDSNFVELNMGISEVRHATNLMPSEVAIPAVQAALDDCPIKPDLIDLIIFCGLEGDNEEPATAHHIQKAVGLDCALCFDIKNACSGFISALQLADTMITAKAVNYALICTGEIPSQITKEAIRLLKAAPKPEIVKNMLGSFTLGDAGGAIIVGPSDGDGFITFGIYSCSRYADLCYYNRQKCTGKMDMARIMARGLEAHKTVYNNAIKNAGWKPRDIDCLITHQTGERLFSISSTLFKVPEIKMTCTYTQYGNVASATLPLNWVIAKNEKRIKTGAKVWIAMGGSGITVAHAGLSVQ